jgi:hypothetical protein
VVVDDSVGSVSDRVLVESDKLDTNSSVVAESAVTSAVSAIVTIMVDSVELDDD